MPVYESLIGRLAAPDSSRLKLIVTEIHRKLGPGDESASAMVHSPAGNVGLVESLPAILAALDGFPVPGGVVTLLLISPIYTCRFFFGTDGTAKLDANYFQADAFGMAMARALLVDVLGCEPDLAYRPEWKSHRDPLAYDAAATAAEIARTRDWFLKVRTRSSAPSAPE